MQFYLKFGCLGGVASKPFYLLRAEPVLCFDSSLAFRLRPSFRRVAVAFAVAFVVGPLIDSRLFFVIGQINFSSSKPSEEEIIHVQVQTCAPHCVLGERVVQSVARLICCREFEKVSSEQRLADRRRLGTCFPIGCCWLPAFHPEGVLVSPFLMSTDMGILSFKCWGGGLQNQLKVVNLIKPSNTDRNRYVM